MGEFDVPQPDVTRWILSFRAEGDGPPVELRVRRLLKAALRCHGLRCVHVAEQVPQQAPGATQSRPRTAPRRKRSQNRRERHPGTYPKPVAPKQTPLPVSCARENFVTWGPPQGKTTPTAKTERRYRTFFVTRF